MALSKSTASKIIEVISVDVECRRAIQPKPSLASLNPITSLLLEFTHTAGSVRNIPLVLKSIVEKKKPEDDPEMTRRLCLGIVAATVKPLIMAVRQGKLPGVHTAGAVSRVHWGVDHMATWIRMEDASEYAFDWHATLNINNPAISRAADWDAARNAISYLFFSGFN